MEVFPCPLGILALRLCRSVAASKSFGHRGGDFGQLTNEGINLFAPFAVSAEAEPDDRWERPQIGFERSSRIRRRSIPRAVALDCRPKVFPDTALARCSTGWALQGVWYLDVLPMVLTS